MGNWFRGVLSGRRLQWANDNQAALQSAYGDSITANNIRAAYKYGRGYESTDLWKYLQSPNAKKNSMLPSDVTQLDASRHENSIGTTTEDYMKYGYNPALMYGGDTNSSAGQVMNNQPSIMNTGSEISDAVFSGVGALTDLGMKNAQMQQISMQNEVAAAQVRNIDANTEKTKADTTNSKDVHDLYTATREYTIKTAEGTATRADADAHIAQINQYIAQRFGYSNAELDNTRRMFETKMVGLEADYQKRFLDLEVRLRTANANKAEEEVKKIHQEAIKLAKECKLLDNDIDNYQENHFLEYMDTASTFINATTGAKNASVNIGVAGFAAGGSQSVVDEIEGYDAINGNILNTIHERWAKTGMYVSDSPENGHYQGMRAPVPKGGTKLSPYYTPHRQPSHPPKAPY